MATKDSKALAPSVFAEALLSAPAVWVGIFAAVATVFIRKQKEAYESALKERKSERKEASAEKAESSEKESKVDQPDALISLEDIEKRWKDEFDTRLGHQDDGAPFA